MSFTERRSIRVWSYEQPAWSHRWNDCHISIIQPQSMEICEIGMDGIWSM